MSVLTHPFIKPYHKDILYIIYIIMFAMKIIIIPSPWTKTFNRKLY